MPVSLKVEFYAVCKNSAFRSGLTIKIFNMSLRLKLFLFITISLNIQSFCQQPLTDPVAEIPYLYNKDHAIARMKFKVLYSLVKDHNAITASFAEDIKNFGEKKYNMLKPLIMEKDIPTLQKLIQNKKLTYKELVTFYIYRIHLIESNPDLAINAIISLNTEAIKEAERCDKERSKTKNKHSIYGMPILLKDNIGFEGLPTTAGAEILIKNRTQDAFIAKSLKKKEQ